MRRRLESPGEFNVWPAFTDVLGGLVVVLVFMITMFVISEVLVGREMTGKDSAIIQLQDIIEHLEVLTGEADAEAARLRERVSGLQADVDNRDQLLEDVRDELAAAEDARNRLSADLENTQNQAQQDVALLSARTERLTAELERLNKALLGNEEELSQANYEIALRDAVIEEQEGRIEQMDDLIKERLLDRVEQLEQYASDFFGRLREVFAGNPNIKVVGDRFVFQSEVLFPSGEAKLSGAGERDLRKFVDVYRQLAAKIPEDLQVIIEVQGHTDRVPMVNHPRFRDNWELSAQRALDVVDYLIKQGIPAQRLAAVGMGEYHPIDPGETPDAYRRNRRIELKITSR